MELTKCIKSSILSLFLLGIYNNANANFDMEVISRAQQVGKTIVRYDVLRVESNYDSVEIKDLYINRGHCYSTAKIRQEMAVLEKKYNETGNKEAKELLAFLEFGSGINNFPRKLVFGQYMELRVPQGCSVKEVTVDTDRGTETAAFK